MSDECRDVIVIGAGLSGKWRRILHLKNPSNDIHRRPNLASPELE